MSAKTENKPIKFEKPKVSKKTLKEWGFAYCFLAYPLILFAIFYIYVNVNSWILAFQDVNLNGTRVFAGLKHFKSFFDNIASSGLVWISMKNSLIAYAFGLIITTPLQLIFSYMLFKKCFAHKVIKILIMMPSIISMFVYSLVFRNLAGSSLQSFMHTLGLTDFPNLMEDTRYVFWTTIFYTFWLAFSSSLIIYPNAMRSVDTGIYESASIDGVCTMWQEMYHIILPLIFPTISTYLVLGVSGMMTDGGPLVPFYMYSAPPEAYRMGYWMTVQIFNDSNPMKFPAVSAAGMILTVFIAPLTLFVKWFLDKIDPTSEEKIYGKKQKV